MKKFSKWIWSPQAAVIALVLAAGLLLFSGISGAMAALGTPSNWFTGRVQMEDIGISLMENDHTDPVAYRDYDYSKADGTWLTNNPGILLEDLPETIVFGNPYDEALYVKNSGTINEYVRVTITKYWLDAEGKKDTTLSPQLIDLELDNLDGEWILDPDASTVERTVLYCTRLVPGNGQEGSSTLPFSKTLTISNKVAEVMHKEYGVDENGNEDKNTIITVYDYDGYSFVLNVRCDAVQEHNAQDAIKSAWGIDATVNNNTLSLGG